jgi:hypothetical protein
MTFGGWITLILSVGFVTTLFGWCIARVLWRRPPIDHLHGLEDIDTRDRGNE